MKLYTYRNKNKADELLLSITKNTDTRMTEVRTDPQENLELIMSKPAETFPFKPPLN